MANKAIQSDEWRLRPWAIVLLVLMAIAFGAQLVMLGLAILTVSTGVMLACWVTLLIMELRKRRPPA